MITTATTTIKIIRIKEASTVFQMFTCMILETPQELNSSLYFLLLMEFWEQNFLYFHEEKPLKDQSV